MKVSLPKNDGAKKREEPVLSLVQEDTYEEDKLKLARFKLRTTPGSTDSPVYDFHMLKIDGSETLRYSLRFMTDIVKVCTGLDITTPDHTARIYRELLKGEALSQFNNGVTRYITTLHEEVKKQRYDQRIAAADTPAAAQAVADAVPVPPEDLNAITQGMRAVVVYMAPHKALTKQKRWMRRFCRKPAGMTIRSFANHLTRINNEELPLLPPFGPRNLQMLSMDEIIDIITNGVPRSWMREMDKQGFDPLEKSLQEVVDFCERMEASEDFDPAREGGKTKSKDGKSNKSPHKGKSSGGSKHCLFHGNNDTHNTDDCLVLKKQVGALRNNKDGDRKPPFKSKTWKRDADKSTNSSKKELAAFVRKQTRKELYAFAKKRKISEDEEDQESVHAMEDGEVSDGEVDLSKLNFGDMNDLKIDSDDDDSVSV